MSRGCVERMQSHGQGSCAYKAIRTEVLSDAHAASSCWFTNTNVEEQSANGRSDAGRDSGISHYNPKWPPIDDRSLVGDGSYEPWTQLAPDTTNHERV